MKGEFKQAVEKITDLKITDRESEFLFKMMDANNDGIIDAEDELNLHEDRTPEYKPYGPDQTKNHPDDQNHVWVSWNILYIFLDTQQVNSKFGNGSLRQTLSN